MGRALEITGRLWSEYNVMRCVSCEMERSEPGRAQPNAAALAAARAPTIQPVMMPALHTCAHTALLAFDIQRYD